MAEVKLKWKGDELYLGATKMAEVRRRHPEDDIFDYSIGPDDHVSEPYQDKEDARNDCFNYVQRLLKKAGG